MPSLLRREDCHAVALGLMLLWGLTISAAAQIIFLPPRPWPGPVPPPQFERLEFKDLSIDAQARDQQGEVQISQTLANTGDTPIESELLFALPEDAAVGNLVLLADGKELTGKLLGKDEARSEFDEIVRRQRDPALLEYAGRGLYRVSVFPIPAKATRTVTLRYTELLKREDGLTNWVLPLGRPGGTGGAAGVTAGHATLHVRIESEQDLKVIYAPSHTVEFQRDGTRKAHLDLDVTAPEQMKDFRVCFGSGSETVGATLLSYKPHGEDGYFLLLASPGLVQAKEVAAQAKSVVFVLDRSGSMTGKKLEQAKGALAFVVKQLHEGDTFNIVVFDDRIETFKPELAAMNAEMRKDALAFVDNIRAGGSTNISDALGAAMGFVNAPAKGGQTPAYVLFLTDGLPTAGETRELQLAQLVRTANTHRARIMTWGVGDDVNARLLDRISSENGGASDYVRPDEDIEAPISHAFARMSQPVLTSPTLQWQGVVANRLYPGRLPDFFGGSQLVLVGRYAQAGTGSLKLRGLVNGEEQEFSYPVTLEGETASTKNEFIARLWATRRIGDLIDQIDLKGQNAELSNEIVALGTQFGILTPYTSFLAREDVQLRSVAPNQAMAYGNMRSLGDVSGSGAVSQRVFKMQMNSATNAPAPAAQVEQLLPSAGLVKVLKSSANSSPDLASDSRRESAHPAVERIGAKTFFWKNGRWEDSSIKPKQGGKPIALKQFSDEWQKLMHGLGNEDVRYLSIREAALVEIGGNVYLIQPDK